MNVLIVYDYQIGTTALVARIVAEALEKFAHTRLITANEACFEDVRDADFIIIGGSSGITPAIQALIDQMPPLSLEGIPAVAFDTQQQRLPSTAGIRAISQVLQSHGAVLESEPAIFFTNPMGTMLARGEPDRAATWAHRIISEPVAASV